MKKSIKIKEPSKLLMHLIAWAVIFLLPYIFTLADYDDGEKKLHINTTFLYLNTVTKIF